MTLRNSLRAQRREASLHKLLRQAATTLSWRNNKMMNETTPTVVPTKNRRDQLAVCERPGGFGANVDVTNLGDPLNGWTLTFAFAGGQTITQLWNGSLTQSGANVSVRNSVMPAACATVFSTVVSASVSAVTHSVNATITSSSATGSLP